MSYAAVAGSKREGIPMDASSTDPDDAAHLKLNHPSDSVSVTDGPWIEVPRRKRGRPSKKVDTRAAGAQVSPAIEIPALVNTSRPPKRKAAKDASSRELLCFVLLSIMTYSGG